MKRTLILAGLLLAFADNSSAQEVMKCKTTDPTGTPLNVRAAPMGKIKRTIKNGEIVVVREFGEDNNGKPWVLIYDAKNHKKIGWVIREFVSCSNQI